MDAVRGSFRLGMWGLGAGAAVALVLISSSVTQAQPTPLTQKDGSPFPTPTQAGATEALWNGKPVVVFVVPERLLAAVDATRGAGQATDSVPLPSAADLRLFVLSGRSTFLGCTVAFNAMLGSSHDEPDYDHDGFADGVLMDRCHQGTWDPYHRGAPVAGPAPTRLAALHVEPRQGILYGDGFDGPTGATHDVRF